MDGNSRAGGDPPAENLVVPGCYLAWNTRGDRWVDSQTLSDAYIEGGKSLPCDEGWGDVSIRQNGLHALRYFRFASSSVEIASLLRKA